MVNNYYLLYTIELNLSPREHTFLLHILGTYLDIYPLGIVYT
jgi:hypothetical protein